MQVVLVGRDKGKDTTVPAPYSPGRPRSPEGLIRVLEAEGIRDRRVLAAFGEVPRARFVPPAAAGQAYLDTPIRIPQGQVTTGLGFQTAILARLASKMVSVERFPAPAAHARANLAAIGLGRVRVAVGDGTVGVPEHAPYQAIVVSAASPCVPAPPVEQLAPGGRLVHPVGPGGREQVTAFHKEAGQLVVDTWLTPAYFAPLVGTHSIRSREGPNER